MAVPREHEHGGRRAADPPPAGLDHHPPHASLHPPRPLRVAITALLLALAAAAAVATAFVGTGPALADRAVLGEAVEERTRALTAVATFVTDAGSTAVMGVLAAVVGLLLLRTHRGVDAIFVIGTAAGASVLFTAIKRLLDRPRPPMEQQLVDAANESLPSGHATMSMAVIGSLVVLAWAGRSTRGRVALVAAAALWVAAVGSTRIYLGVHWFSDVVAGWLVGAAWLALCATAWSWWRARAAAAAPDG